MINPTTKTPVTLTTEEKENESRKMLKYFSESSHLMVWILALETRPSSVGPDDSLSLGEDLPVVVNVMFSTWYIIFGSFEVDLRHLWKNIGFLQNWSLSSVFFLVAMFLL